MKGLGTGLVIGIACIVLLAYCGSDSRKTAADRCDDPIAAWVMAQEFVNKRLKAPATASYPWYDASFVTKTGVCAYRVRAYVDAENSFGAKLRNQFSVELHPEDEKTWRATSVIVE